MCVEHLWTVVNAQKGSNSADVRRSGSNVMGSGPLFQYRSYQEQESLQLNAKDVSVIVDTVCRSQRVPEESVWGEMDPQEIWDAGSKSIGDACVTILIKLIMDMYIEHGPSVAYVLVLQMLHQALLNTDVAVRIRAFDVVYNLSLHSLMMSNTPDAAFFEKENNADKAHKRFSRDMSSPCRSPIGRLQTLSEEGENGMEPHTTDDPVPQECWTLHH